MGQPYGTIQLIVNRNAGPAFVRYMWAKHRELIPEQGDVIKDRGVTILTLTPRHLNLFRLVLELYPDRFENAEVILRGLGKECTE